MSFSNTTILTTKYYFSIKSQPKMQVFPSRKTLKLKCSPKNRENKNSERFFWYFKHSNKHSHSLIGGKYFE